jgi:hypothetical protein
MIRIAVALSSLAGSFALNNGVARLPPMGWRSWEAYYGGVNEKAMEATFTAMADKSRGTSLLELGFSDVGLDAGFEACSERKVGGLPAFHSADCGKPGKRCVLVDKGKVRDQLLRLGSCWSSLLLIYPATNPAVSLRFGRAGQERPRAGAHGWLVRQRLRVQQRERVQQQQLAHD